MPNRLKVKEGDIKNRILINNASDRQLIEVRSNLGTFGDMFPTQIISWRDTCNEAGWWHFLLLYMKTALTTFVYPSYSFFCLFEYLGGGPRVVVSTAAFHARVRGSVPGLGGLKETKLFLPHPRVKVSIVGSLRDREVACSASDRQGSNFESCVWRTVSSQSSHHPQEVLLAQFSLYVHKGGLKPDSFHFIWIPMLWVHDQCKYFYSYSAGSTLHVESELYIRKIMTSKVDPAL